MSFLNALPGAVAEGMPWGLMAIGVYLSFTFLDAKLHQRPVKQGISTIRT